MPSFWYAAYDCWLAVKDELRPRLGATWCAGEAGWLRVPLTASKRWVAGKSRRSVLLDHLLVVLVDSVTIFGDALSCATGPVSLSLVLF